jgi:hypothetical protein
MDVWLAAMMSLRQRPWLQQRWGQPPATPEGTINGEKAATSKPLASAQARERVDQWLDFVAGITG